MTVQATLDAIVGKIETLAPTASPEQAAYLAKAFESVYGKGAVQELIDEGSNQQGLLNTEAQSITTQFNNDFSLGVNWPAGQTVQQGLDFLRGMEGLGIIGSVTTNSARQNVYSTGEWSSSSAWTTYYNNWQDTNSRIQGWNMLLGDGYPNGTSQSFNVNDHDSAMNRQKEYAHQNRLGHYYRDFFYYDNASTGNDYAGITLRCLPIRNTTNSPVTQTFWSNLSCGVNAYGGASLTLFTPNAQTYAGATGGEWSNLTTHAANTNHWQPSGSVVVPANTTVLLVATSAHRYYTTYRFKDTNFFSNLHTSFAESNGLVCDLVMLEALATARIDGDTHTTANPHKLYNACAQVYGDR
jgi:hypothetical protein